MLVLVAYVVLLPVITLLWLWRSPELKRLPHLQHQPVVFQQTTAIEASAATAKETAPALPTADPILTPFLGDSGYAMRFWWWRHVDLIAMLVLAANQAAQPRPSTVPLIVSCVCVPISQAGGPPPLPYFPPPGCQGRHHLPGRLAALHDGFCAYSFFHPLLIPITLPAPRARPASAGSPPLCGRP